MLDNLLQGKGVISDMGRGQSLTVGVGTAVFFIVFDFR